MAVASEEHTHLAGELEQLLHDAEPLCRETAMVALWRLQGQSNWRTQLPELANDSSRLVATLARSLLRTPVRTN